MKIRAEFEKTEIKNNLIHTTFISINPTFVRIDKCIFKVRPVDEFPILTQDETKMFPVALDEKSFEEYTTQLKTWGYEQK